MLLTQDCWLPRRAAHERRAAAVLAPFLARRRRGETHPVEDFLFAYYTPPATPRNTLRPSRFSQLEFEHPGCLHANMDLFKWGVQADPLVSGELTVDCFELARAVRAVDMRASPYDLTELGYEPIAIETPAGKATYVTLQKEFGVRARALRSRLLSVCENALG